MSARVALSLRRLEWALLWRDPALRAAWLALVLACALALWAGTGHVTSLARAWQDMARGEQQQLARYRALAAQAEAGIVTPASFRDPRNPAAFARRMLATYAARDTLPSAVLGAGPGELRPWYFKVNADARDKAQNAYEYVNPHLLQTGRFDFAFVLLWLFPLAAIAAGHGVGTQDRALGVAGALAVTASSVRALYLRRLAWRIGLLTAVLCAAETAGLLWVRIAWPAQAQGWAIDLAAWVGLTLAYALFWYACIAAVVARMRVPASALAWLVGLWLGFTLLVPVLAQASAQLMRPMPSRPAYMMAVRDVAAEAARDRAAVLRAYAAAHPALVGRLDEQAARSLSGDVLNLAQVAWIEARMQPDDDAFVRRQFAQERWLARFSPLSPALLLQSQIERLAGTDLARQRDFVDQVEAFRRRLRDAVAVDAFARVPATLAQFERNAAYPRFHYRPWRSPRCTAADLLAWMVLLGAAAGSAVLRWRRQRD